VVRVAFKKKIAHVIAMVSRGFKLGISTRRAGHDNKVQPPRQRPESGAAGAGACVKQILRGPS